METEDNYISWNVANEQYYDFRNPLTNIFEIILKINIEHFTNCIYEYELLLIINDANKVSLL